MSDSLGPKLSARICWIVLGDKVTWGPFLESPGNFSGPKSNIQIEM